MNIRGRVELEKLCIRTGKVETLLLGDNIIVQGCKTAVCHILAGDSATSWYCDRMQFGVGTLAEEEGNTELQSPITPVKAISDYDYPGEPGWGYTDRCRFTAYLAANEANGFPISEAGLLAANSTLLARKTFPGQVKTPDYIFTFRWTVIRA